MSEDNLPDDLRERLDELEKLGCVTGADWADYAWKNELLAQCDRVLSHMDEIVRDEPTDHNPCHMLERALSIAAVSMRRLIETRSVSDEFQNEQVKIYEVRRAQECYRTPLGIYTTGEIFNNFDMTRRTAVAMRPWPIVNKLLHARIIAVLSGSHHLPDGLLVASDHQQKQSLFHFTAEEFRALCNRFLDDRVSIRGDSRDPRTGEVTSYRKRAGR